MRPLIFLCRYAAVFDESATDKVILGEDGWLYYADTLADFEGTAPMSERQIWNVAHTLALMEEYAASRGAEFVFAAAPNKNTLYPQQMPYEKGKKTSNLERIQAALTAENVAFCDLLTVFSAQNEPVYYKTDSHWDGFGSALAHDSLLKTLGREGELAEEQGKEKYGKQALKHIGKAGGQPRNTGYIQGAGFQGIRKEIRHILQSRQAARAPLQQGCRLPAAQQKPRSLGAKEALMAGHSNKIRP